ncbi:hypothetical protein C1645_737933 [Glomus cerebriforme]|uniref:Uncharacterized protein n=1 Tax=Glomus cerebriforme TaxID=658196 RepID=A0A397SZ28_9GLOM|nr:hypothetical protein C1645_737933 [Glomus cerebriforme]
MDNLSAISIFDSVIDQQNDVNTKSIEDKKIGDFISEELANVSDLVIVQPKQCKPLQIKEVTTKVNHQEGSLEDRKMDAFLDEVHKKKVAEELILKESSAESVMSSHLFDKAEKTSQKEKLQWYYYSEEYKKRVVIFSSKNNISD